MWLPALAINNAQSLLNDRFKLMSLTFSVAYLNIYHSKCIYSFIMSLCLNNKNNKHAKKEFICRVFSLYFLICLHLIIIHDDHFDVQGGQFQI